MVTLYSKPGCPPCVQTKARLKQKGIEYNEFDVTQDDAALRYVKALGYTGVPVVVVSPSDHWVGFDADRIDSLA